MSNFDADRTAHLVAMLRGNAPTAHTAEAIDQLEAAAMEIAAARKLVGCREAAERECAALRAEVERLRRRVLEPMTAQEVVSALHEGRAEAMAATGDHAWTSLIAQRDSLRGQVERLRNGLLCPDCGLGVAVDEDACCKTCGRDCFGFEDGRSKMLEQYVDEFERVATDANRMRRVFEAAKQWNYRYAPLGGLLFSIEDDDRALHDAVDAAIIAEREEIV